jgi:putative zinc finger protein
MAALTCTDIRELFSARIDDALSAEERARLDAHLATCAECPREWQSFERSVALVRGMEPARASVGFVDRVLAARPRPWYRRLGRSLLVPWPVKLPLEAAAIVLVAGLAILIVQGSPELQQAARAPVTPPASMPRTARPPVPVAKGESAQRTTPRTGARTEGQHLYALPDEAKERASEPAPADTRAEPPRSRDAGPPAGSPRVAAESRAKTTDAVQTLSRQDTERDRAAAPGQAASAPAAPAPAAPAPTASAPAASPEEALAPSSAATAAPAPAARAMQKSGELRNVTAAGANVQARLAAGDPATSERAVRDLVTRAGGRIVSRAGDGDAAVLELAVPADRWDEVQRGLQALGSLRLDDTRGNRTDPVRILLRLER